MRYNYQYLKDNYMTPPELVKIALDWINNNKFGLDTCCSIKNIPAVFHCIKGITDGLISDWCAYNWCNPPFQQSKQWIKKAFDEQQKGNTTIMLIPVRTETKYWHDYILFNPNVEIKWLRKGYCFIDPDTRQKCGVYKNALALVKFNGICQHYKNDDIKCPNCSSSNIEQDGTRFNYKDSYYCNN